MIDFSFYRALLVVCVGPPKTYDFMDRGAPPDILLFRDVFGSIIHMKTYLSIWIGSVVKFWEAFPASLMTQD